MDGPFSKIILLKIYFDAWLSNLIKASGYNPNSIGTNFKQTHNIDSYWNLPLMKFLQIF